MSAFFRELGLALSCRLDVGDTVPIPMNRDATILAAEVEAGIGVEHLVEVGPFGVVHAVEGVEIKGDDFRRVFGEEVVDGLFQFCVVHCFRDLFNDAVVVLDAERIQKVSED